MAKINVAATPEATNQIAPETPAENLTAPDTPDIPKSPTPKMTEGEVAAPSNVIERAFGDKELVIAGLIPYTPP
jgi:hypothetical protein